MKKKHTYLIVVVILLIIAVLAYVIFHKPAKVSAPSASAKAQSVNVNNSVVQTKSTTTVGVFMTDPNGNTLYTYKGDSKNVSNCTGACLASWPIYQDKGSTTDLPVNIAVIKRTDNGQYQYTYKGSPLYYFINDSQGQVNGNGQNGFNVVKP